MVDLDEFALSKLARELAMNIRNYKAVFADFGIDETDYYEIEKIDFFRRAKDQYVLEWNSALSAADRVKLVSAAYIEATLPTIGRRMLDEKEPLSNVIDAGKFLAKNAGIGEPKTGPGNGERFIIQLNIGNDANGKEIVEVYNKSIAIDANDPADVNMTNMTENGGKTGEKQGENPQKHPKTPDPREVAFAAFTMEDAPEPEPDPIQIDLAPPRKRGRPKGSKNRHPGQV